MILTHTAHTKLFLEGNNLDLLNLMMLLHGKLYHKSRISDLTALSMLLLAHQKSDDHNYHCIKDIIPAKDARPTVRPTMRGTFVEDF